MDLTSKLLLEIQHAFEVGARPREKMVTDWLMRSVIYFDTLVFVLDRAEIVVFKPVIDISRRTIAFSQKSSTCATDEGRLLGVLTGHLA